MNASRPLSCRTARPYLSALADGELVEPLASAVAGHAAVCRTCGEIVAHHRSVAAQLADLPPSEPSPEVFQRVLAARAPQVVGPVAHESLRPRAGHTRHVRRLAFLAALIGATAATPYRSRPRPALWVALPALAAVLVLALTLFALHRVPQQTAGSANASMSQPMSGNPLIDAHIAADGQAQDLGFAPVLPRFLPQGARFVSAHITPAAALGGAARLDISWTLSGSVAALHVRESSQALAAWGDYRAQSSPLRLAWQIPGYQPWRGVLFVPDGARWAVAQSRAAISIAADVSFADQTGADEQARVTAEDVLRLVTLSMDAAPDLSSAPLPPDPAATVVHYIAQGIVGGTRYVWEAYLDAAGGRGRIDVRDAAGDLLYSDVIAGGALTRYDAGEHVYQRIAAGDYPAEAQIRPGVAAFFAAGNSYVQVGKLWRMGLTQWRGRTLARFALTTAPYLTYLYVDPATLRVVGASVDVGSADQPGTMDGLSQLASASECLSYTLVDYLRPSDVPSGALEAPASSGYVPGRVHGTITCGG